MIKFIYLDEWEKKTMYLHQAKEKLIKSNGRPMTISEIAKELNKKDWYQKKDASPITGFQIRGRTKNYPALFQRKSSTVSLVDNTNK